jgi:hypothetical protein
MVQVRMYINYAGKGYINRYNLIDRPSKKTKVSDFGASDRFFYQFTKPFHKFKLVAYEAQGTFFQKK